MGCGSSKEAKRQEEREIVHKFVQLATEENEEGWVDCSREQDGPRGTKMEYKVVNGQTYWRGSATFHAPIDLVLWFLGNQAEFNSLSDTIDKQVLDPAIASLAFRNTRKVLKMKKKSHSSVLRWNIHMPSPVAPRQFFVKESNVKLPGGKHAIIQRSIHKDKSRGANENQQQTDFRKSTAGSTFSSSARTGSALSSGGESSERPKSRKIPLRPSSLNSVMSLRPLSLRKSTKQRPKSQQPESISVTEIISHPSPHPRSNRRSDALSGYFGSSSFDPVVQSILQRTPPVRRGKVLISGYLLEPAFDKKYTTVHFVNCVDAVLTDDDHEAILARPELITEGEDLTPAETMKKAKSIIEDILGKSRVLSCIESPRRYFEDPKSIWSQQLFRLASAKVGEFGFEDLEKKRHGEDKMQTGTHVEHRVHGHGIIKQFDLHGKAHVQFDSGKEIVFSTDGVNKELSAAVEVGARVVHEEHGEGTVKQFDSSRIHVKFDNGEYHRYSSESWKSKIKLIGNVNDNVKMSKCRQIDLDGITSGNLKIQAGVTAPKPELKRKRTLSLTKLKRQKNKDPHSIIAAPVLRITFIIPAASELILDYIRSYKEDEKAGNILEDEVLQQHSARHTTRYQRLKYPQDLNDRDIVYDTCWSEVDKDTFVVVSKSTESPICPPVPGIVRGNLVIRGYLLEPLYDSTRPLGGTYFTRVTYITCVEPKGFVPPKVVDDLNRTELVGIVTDMRAYFYKIASSTPFSAAHPSKQFTEFAKDKTMRRTVRRQSTLEYR